MGFLRGSAAIALLAGVSVALVIVVVVVVVVRPEPAEERPSVRYITVDASAVTAHVGGHELAVSIELETTSRMPHVAPHVRVSARCGPALDEDKAFFMDLSNARPGDRKVDTVRLFGIHPFDTPPDRCELTLALTEGASPPERYCFQGGRTTPGACP